VCTCFALRVCQGCVCDECMMLSRCQCRLRGGIAEGFAPAWCVCGARFGPCLVCGTLSTRGVSPAVVQALEDRTLVLRGAGRRSSASRPLDGHRDSRDRLCRPRAPRSPK
jgi:hypothetical protein